MYTLEYNLKYFSGTLSTYITVMIYIKYIYRVAVFDIREGIETHKVHPVKSESRNLLK